MQSLAAQFKPRSGVGESVSAVESSLPSWLPPCPFPPSLFDENNVAKLRKSFQSARPYSYIHIPNLADETAIKNVRSDILQHLSTNYRETDLFKVSQTMDLNNISLSSSFAPKIPSLLSLRTHIYSEKFRSFLSEVTGCGRLSDRVDCAANLYTSGSHLLCHDDVITTRKLSYIIYLSLPPMELQREREKLVGVQGKNNSNITDANVTDSNSREMNSYSTTDTLDPSDPSSSRHWSLSYGGNLELFDSVYAKILPNESSVTNTSGTESKEGEKTPETQTKSVLVPLTTPSTIVHPIFNSIVVFEVKAGQSFHAVQEVYTRDATRISIQVCINYIYNHSLHSCLSTSTIYISMYVCSFIS